MLKAKTYIKRKTAVIKK